MWKVHVEHKSVKWVFEFGQWSIWIERALVRIGGQHTFRIHIRIQIHTNHAGTIAAAYTYTSKLWRLRIHVEDNGGEGETGDDRTPFPLHDDNGSDEWVRTPHKRRQREERQQWVCDDMEDRTSSDRMTAATDAKHTWMLAMHGRCWRYLNGYWMKSALHCFVSNKIENRYFKWKVELFLLFWSKYELL